MTSSHNVMPMRPFLILPAIAILLAVLSALSPVTGILLGGAILVSVVSLVPVQALWLLVFLIPLTSGLPRYDFFPIRVNEILLGTITLAIGSYLWRKRRLLSLEGLTEYAIIFFLLFASVVPLIVHFLRGRPFSAEIMPYLAPWQYYILYKLIASLRLSERSMCRLLQGVVLAGVVLAVVSILQAAHVQPVQRFLQVYYPSEHLDLIQDVGYSRTTSLLGNWHGAGVYYAFSLLTLFVAWSEGKHLFSLGVQPCIILLLALALMTTNSFTAFGVLFFGLIVSLYQTGRLRSRRVWIVTLLILSVVLVSGLIFSGWLYKQVAFQFSDFGYGYGSVSHPQMWLPRTVANRLTTWQTKLWPFIRGSWLVGYGPTLPDIGVRSDDSQFVYMLLKGGILYVMAFCVLAVFLLGIALRRYRRSLPGTWYRIIALLSFVLLAAILPACFLQAYMNYSGVAEYIWVVVGMMSGARFVDQRETLQHT